MITRERRLEIQAKYRDNNRDKLRDASALYYWSMKASNPEKLKEYVANRKLNHTKEEINANVRAYRAKNPLKSREACARYHQAHIEYMHARARKYLQEHPEQNRAAARRRRAIKYQAEGSHTQSEIRELLAQQENQCAYCAAKLGADNPPTLDHFMPLTKGGSENIGNLRWACKKCNSRKYNKHPDEWMRIIRSEVE